MGRARGSFGSDSLLQSHCRRRPRAVELETICKVKNGFEIGETFTKAGWTFFNLQLSSEMVSMIEKSGMMEGALGYRIAEQLKNFLGHFLELRGSQVRITKINY